MKNVTWVPNHPEFPDQWDMFGGPDDYTRTYNRMSTEWCVIRVRKWFSYKYHAVKWPNRHEILATFDTREMAQNYCQVTWTMEEAAKPQNDNVNPGMYSPNVVHQARMQQGVAALYASSLGGPINNNISSPGSSGRGTP